MVLRMKRPPKHDYGNVPEQLRGKLIGSSVKRLQKETGRDIGMAVVNIDGSPMSAQQFEDTVAENPELLIHLTKGGTKEVFPFRITLRCGCYFVFTRENWPSKSLGCKHGNIYVKTT